MAQYYLSPRSPVNLVFYQDFDDPDNAIEGEKQIKNWSRKKKEALIQGDFDLLPLLSKKKFED